MRAPLPKSASASLPVPAGPALQHTQACANMLRAEIARNNGWLSFARFMELALYAPGLGYYAAGARKFGADGDFVTAPEISSLFGQSLANVVADVLRQTGGDVLELGPGSGKLAMDLLQALDALGVLPDRYCLLEVSADLRQRQQQALADLPPHLAQRATWLDTMPMAFTGMIVANEVLDVVPVHLLRWHAGQVFERGVSCRDGDFVWQDVADLSPALADMAAAIAHDYFRGMPPDDYLSEVAPVAGGLVASVAESLSRGAALFIDYGFRGGEFYHPQRSMGTLMCHYRHYAHADPFQYPGLQDITAHVDFTAIADSGIAAGLELAGYTTQANFLLASGLTELLAKSDPQDPARYLPLRNQLQRLVSPAEMGEFFKVIGFTRGNVSIAAFASSRAMPL